MKDLLPQNGWRYFLFFLLLAIIFLLEVSFFDTTPVANVGWFIPMLAALFFFKPGRAAALVLLTIAAFIIHLPLADYDSGNYAFIVAIPLVGIVAAIVSTITRKTFVQAGLVRDALDKSPMAFAEFKFPGYGLVGFNKNFLRMAPDDPAGRDLATLLPKGAADHLHRMMDDAVSSRERVQCREFRLVTHNGSESFWSIDVVPVFPRKHGAARSVSLFAQEITNNVIRNHNREAALRMSTAFMSSLDMDKTLDIILENMTHSCGADTGVLFMVEDEQWVAKATVGAINPEEVGQLRIPYDDLWPVVEALLSKSSRTTEEPLTDFCTRALTNPALKSDSNLVIPLLAGSRTIGAVWCIKTGRARKFKAEHISFATIVGTQAALAIENASIYENERTMRKSLEAIEAISEAGLTSLNLEAVLRELVTRTQDVMQMDAAMILLADARGEYLELRAAAGLIAESAVNVKVRTGEGLIGRAYKDGCPLKIDNISNHENEMYPFTSDSGILSVLAVPLRFEGRTAGVLQIGSLHESAFSAREWGLIQVLADRASHAVQNSMLHAKTRKELGRVELLHDVAAACAGTQDMRYIAKQALDSIYQQLGCATAGIFYHDMENEVLINLAFLGHSDDARKDLEVLHINRDTLLNKAVNERMMVTHDNWPDLSRDQAQVLADIDALENRRAALPIVYKDDVVGGMALTMPGSDPWSEGELDTLRSIANQIAVAMSSSKLPRLDGMSPGMND